MITKLWPLMIGFTIWSVGFVALYAVQALGCVWLWPEPRHRLALMAMAASTLVLLVATFVWLVRTRQDPLTPAALALTVAAIATAVLTFAPVVFTTICQ